MSLRDRSHDIQDFPGALLIDDREIELGSAGSLRFLVLAAELAGEQTAGQRTPNQESNLFGFEQRRQLAFKIAARDRIVGLQALKTRKVFGLGDTHRSGDLPSLPVRNADVSHLALSDESVERAQCFFDRSDGVVSVDLVQVDVVGL